MQDKDQSVQENGNTAVSADAVTVAANKAAQSDFVQKIIDKIKHSENILIALSRDPSIDEIAAAIGLTVYLDSKQKHATAIYSGRTPENLAFLQPDATFETNTDSLQDFIIALNKDKADHLRYKLEGDFVKVFITPYKTNITEDDLTFSHGDYNVDFVIAINVPSAGNLDEALREHGRIMHDASAVNITTGQPGRFGEIEWSNPVASSLCEMITELIFAMQGDDETPLDRDIATALLTGIVAATDRFSNERTNSDTLSIASRLMSMGADQQLISSNVKGNEIIRNVNEQGLGMQTAHNAKDKRTNLTVDHDDDDKTERKPVNPYANMDPAEIAKMNASENAGMNPAAQLAPNLNGVMNSPSPQTMVSDTNNVTPGDVVVQPVIPGATVSSNVTAGAASAPLSTAVTPAGGVSGTAVPVAMTTAAPVDPGQMQIPNTPVMVGQASTTGGVSNAAPAPVSQPAVSATAPTAVASGAPVENTVTAGVPDPAQMRIPVPVAAMPSAEVGVTGATVPAPAPTSASRSMAMEVPVEPTVKQVGNTIQPPAASPRKAKNYAEMMEQALAGEDEPAPEAQLAPDAATMSLPVSPQPTAMPPVAEPVANPFNNTILPPPPAPGVGPEMMPPVLPKVQM